MAYRPANHAGHRSPGRELELIMEKESSEKESSEKEAGHFTDYLAHVLFVVAQCYCGAFLVLLLGPLIFFLWSTELTLPLLLASFPRFWARVPKDFGGVLVAAVLAYPIGLVAAEFFYRSGRFLRLHNDLNLETSSADAEEKQQLEHFRQKIQMQESPSYSRIWEWENFQSAVFYYAEWISLTFTALYSLSLAIALYHSSSAPNQMRASVFAGALWVFSVVFFFVMRRARIGKYDSFRLANRAIKQLLKEKDDARASTHRGHSRT
jgi:hypothetical protein